MTMKKLCSVLLVCVVLAMVFVTAALAETTVGNGSKNIYGSGTLTITASQAPRYIYVTIFNCSGASYGIITVKKPNGTSYSNFLEFDGNVSNKKVRVYNTVSGDYDFNVAYTGGSCTISVTMTR